MVAPYGNLGEFAAADHAEARERLADPSCGVAVVDLGTDVSPLMSAIRAGTEAILVGDDSEKSQYWYHRHETWSKEEQTHYPHRPEDLGVVLPTTLGLLPELSDTLRSVLNNVRSARHNMSSMRGSTICVEAHRRVYRHAWNNTLSVLAWVGVSHPGLSLGLTDQEVAIDEIPAGKVVLVRGGRHQSEHEQVKIRESYRSKERRHTIYAY